MNPNQDNGGQAPIIPAGTERTVFGSAAFQPQMMGQAHTPPAVVSPQVNPATVPQQATNVITFEELAAKKGFKSADDLAKAYVESEQQKTRVEMGMSELLKVRTTEVPQASVPTPVQQQNVQSNEDAIKIVQAIAASAASQAMKPLSDRLELQDVFAKNPDAQQYAPQMAEVVKNNPSLSWVDAYKLAKYDSLDSSSREAGKQEAYQTITQKQTVSVGASQPTSKTGGEDLRSLIKDRSIPMSEISKIMRERFQH